VFLTDEMTETGEGEVIGEDGESVPIDKVVYPHPLVCGGGLVVVEQKRPLGSLE
jgi:hypothetical protein